MRYFTALILAIVLPRITSAQYNNDYFLFTADFNGDGITDTATSDSINAPYGNSGGRFDIHLVDAAGQTNEIGCVHMHPLAANLKIMEPGKGELTVYIRGGHDGRLVTYEISTNGIQEIRSRPLSPSDGGIQADRELYMSYFAPDVRLKAIRIEKKPQQAGPGYPPQGVGSPDP